VYIQHRLLHPLMGEVPDGDHVVQLGSADVKRDGTDITLVAYSYALTKALAVAEALAGQVSVEVVDPRSLVPLDVETLVQSARKTRRMLVVHEAPERAGAGAEIVRQVVEADVDFAAPPQVLGSRPVAMPYSPPLEDYCLPQVSDIVARLKAMVAQGAKA
jgi:pyruvate dehydrogenase E1 component beta subunit